MPFLISESLALLSPPNSFYRETVNIFPLELFVATSCTGFFHSQCGEPG